MDHRQGKAKDGDQVQQKAEVAWVTQPLAQQPLRLPERQQPAYGHQQRKANPRAADIHSARHPTPLSRWFCAHGASRPLWPAQSLAEKGETKKEKIDRG